MEAGCVLCEVETKLSYEFLSMSVLIKGASFSVPL